MDIQKSSLNTVYAYHRDNETNSIIVPIPRDLTSLALMFGGIIIWLVVAAVIDIINKKSKDPEIENKYPEIGEAFNYICDKYRTEFRDLYNEYALKFENADSPKEYTRIYKEFSKQLEMFFTKKLKNSPYENYVSGQQLADFVISCIIDYAEAQRRKKGNR